MDRKMGVFSKNVALVAYIVYFDSASQLGTANSSREVKAGSFAGADEGVYAVHSSLPGASARVQ
jgi:hypothetical protein